MTKTHLAAAAALLVACFGGAALADNTNVIRIKNPKASTVTVEYSIGNDATCLSHSVSKQPIPGGDTFKLTLKAPVPKFCCLRVAGTSKWSIAPLKGGKDYDLAIE
ncbi:MAG TPA: hypothetical protein VGM56_24255 [Byssovorax sp.]|jgi:hypothetical protein